MASVTYIVREDSRAKTLRQRQATVIVRAGLGFISRTGEGLTLS
jgi:hypothetical protein